MKRRKHPTSNIQHRTSNDGDADAWTLNELIGSNQRMFDLEERLLEFASAVIDLSQKLPNSRAGNHVAGQIPRSGTSPYPQHGEAEDTESRDDFIYKQEVCLKELRETRRWARLIKRKNWSANDSTLTFVLGESDELIRIFYSSIQTARKNSLLEKRKSPPAYPAREAG